MTTSAIPDSFEPLEPSPFGERIGPLYLNGHGAVPVLGLRVEPHHANRGARVHGGVLMTLADIALSRAVRAQLPPGATMWTADLQIAFLEGAGEGEWVEAQPNVDRLGRSLVHASCVLRAGERELAKAMATFAVRVPGLD
jgi:acyl-coenzyme A thioesterase 13